jgi:hypothetical protein
MYMLLPFHRNVDQNEDIEIAKKQFENVAQLI